jgi:hypothetical protein
MAIEAEMTLKEMEEVVFPHPTVSEIFKETIMSYPLPPKGEYTQPTKGGF